MAGTDWQPVMCCICAGRVEERQPDPVLVTISSRSGSRQDVFAHVACLRDVIHVSVPLLVGLSDLDKGEQEGEGADG